MRAPRLVATIKALTVALGTVFLLLLGAGMYLYYLSGTLPELGQDPTAFKAARTSVVYAADGSVLAEWHGEQDRTMVSLEGMAPSVRHAVVAIEDERFYQHQGVDTRAIVRALRANAESGEYSQGGSTITQQLVKLLFTDGKRTLTRKIREALLAFQLESKAEKDDVLAAYMNLVYFGKGAYGVESAAEAYFGKGAADLELQESALLAGLIAAPNSYSPVDNPGAVKTRRDLVLKKMREQGFISEEEELKARAVPIALAAPRDIPEVAPYFVEWVKAQLIEKLGADAVYMGGLRVQTTLDPQAQHDAEGAAAAVLPKSGDPEVALVSIDHSSGNVVAMVGGRDFRKHQFNLAAQGKRQPGSAFKPFVLVTALEKGISPDAVFSAAPYSVKVKDGVWKVQNYENEFTSSKLTLRAATNWSVNAVYARLIMKVGPAEVVKTARKMGITSPLEPNPAIALGGLSKGVSPLEMASAYGTIANGGVHLPPNGIVKVTNDKGDLIFEPERPQRKALSESIAVKTSLMLHDVVEGGTGTDAKMKTWAAGKTGTTQSYRDAWFVGYARNLTTAVWVGYRQGQVDMLNVHGIKVTGGSFPARIWKRYTEKALSQQSVSTSPPATQAPKGATKTARVRICRDSLLLANKRCPYPVDMTLEASLVPRRVCDIH